MDIQLTDLWIECPECKGEGHIKTKTGNPDQGLHGHIAESCIPCKGKGGSVTPGGDAVLRFVSLMRQKGKLHLS